MKLRIALVIAACSLAACSKSNSSSSGAAGSAGSAAASAGGSAAPAPPLPPQVDAFHALLAPLWHSPQGDARRDATCAALPKLHDAATAVANAAPPAIPDPQPWAKAVVHLAVAVDALKQPCDAKDTAAFDSAFHDVHEHFHAVMAAGGSPEMEHHEHGDMHGSDEHKP